MYKFGQEITPVLSGTTWPVQVAQYDRYIQSSKWYYVFGKDRMSMAYAPGGFSYMENCLLLFFNMEKETNMGRNA